MRRQHRYWTMMTSVACVLSMVAVGQAKDLVVAPNDAAGLITAITQANATPEADTILLTGTYTLTTVDNDTDGPNGLPSITTPVTMTRSDPTIATEIVHQSGSPGFRFFHVVPTGELTLDGIDLSGGGVEENGGAIFNAGKLMLSQVTLANNRVHSNGGAIFNAGGEMLLEQTVIRNNVDEDGAGGGIHNAAGKATLR